MPKLTFCEFCPSDGGDCSVCASREVLYDTWPGIDKGQLTERFPRPTCTAGPSETPAPEVPGYLPRWLDYTISVTMMGLSVVIVVGVYFLAKYLGM